MAYDYRACFSFILSGMAPDYSEDGVSSEWGDKKFKHTTMKLVSGEGHHAWDYSPAYIYRENKSKFPVGAAVGQVRTDGPVDAYFPDCKFESIMDASVYNWVWLDVGEIVEPNIEAGYEFFGWRYYGYGVGKEMYYGAELTADGKYYYGSVVIKPECTFSGCFEVIDAKVGRIKALVHTRYGVETYGSTNTYKAYFLVPIVKYIQRTVNFDTAGGQSVSPMVCEGTTSISLPLPVRNGYDFAGWYSSESYDASSYIGKNGTSYFAPEDNVTLYAKWTAKTMDVYLDAGEGSVAPQVLAVTFDSGYGELPTPTRTGYGFGGWYTEPDGSGVRIVSSSRVDRSDDHTLYAKWTGVTVRITKKDVDNPDAGASSIGKMSLFSSSNGYTDPVATDEDGVIEYNGPAVGYRLICEIGETGQDYKWKPLGVLTAGEYKPSYEYAPTIGADMDIVYWVQRKKMYQVTLDYNTESGNVVISSPETPDEDGKYIEGRDVGITASPNPGWVLEVATVLNPSGIAIATYTDIKDNTFVVEDISQPIRVRLEFAKIQYDIDARIDDPSSGAVSRVKTEMDGETISTATYGDEIEYVAEIADGYLFAGWYDDNGELVSAVNPYKFTVTGAVKYTAKAMVRVTMDVRHVDNRESPSGGAYESCKLLIGGNEVPVPYTTETVLGDAIQYQVTLGPVQEGSGESWKFNAWLDEDGNKLPYLEEGELVPGEAMNLTAEVLYLIPTHTLKISFHNEDEDDAIIPPAVDYVTTVPAMELTVATDNSLSASVVGTQTINLTFVDAIEVEGSELSFSEAISGTESHITSSFAVLVNKDVSITVRYGTTGVRRVSVDFASKSDWTMGVVTLDELSSNNATLPLFKDVEKKTEVVLTAVPKNGYLFAGWFLDHGGIGTPYSTSETLQVKVLVERGYYAKFSKNRNAVYEWEGSSESKMMEWTSKTYAATRPFNPSACRVDTTGYPVAQLSVEMFSAPDTKATAKAQLTNIQSQTARRLPLRRMERYMQISIKSSTEVDTMIVSTSMGGLAV